jgi:alkylhydroperoxidase family enzyme
VLNDTRALDVRLAGILHDDRSDGQGRAGLAFMTVGALDIRPMNDEDTVEGGWEGSVLRSWLNGEAREMLDDDLAAFATMAATARIGCSWCLDFGYVMAHHRGLDETRAREVPRWRESEVFTPVERRVMEYAEAMCETSRALAIMSLRITRRSCIRPKPTKERQISVRQKKTSIAIVVKLRR